MTTNWAGNITFGATALHRPTSVAEVQEIIARSERVRALGSGHSFNRIADTDGVQVSLAALPRRVEIGDGEVTVTAGLRYGELVAELDAAGYALLNMGSLPHIVVAGAAATGTHGSGVANQVLAAGVSAVQLVGADAEVRTLRRGDPAFPGAVISLGALGIVTAMTLDLQPAFGMRQWVYEGLRGFEDVEEVLSAAYSVSLYTHWRGEGFEQVWVKQRDTDPEPPARWLGMTRADAQRHPVGGDPAQCTPQLGQPGRWYEVLPHFRLEFTPSSGDELQSEYFVPRAALVDALRALEGVRERLAPALMVAEVRSIAADDLWLSPAQGRDTIALHFTWYPEEGPARRAVAAVEEALAPLDARPHWGKVFSTSPERVGELWPHLPDAAALIRQHDPEGKFRNALLDTYLPR
ncbi:D-arabinono-1,4-lactone oxidase [Pseudonocardia sp. TRM90224]|uniref:D-arabinono-1,4-lactone oxidase n=1 Tax=Pseudonocardia sp. TRM90224 TaxID=2812678 RepID=UPI001E42A8B8|nr:D-arabinono-1,4-lactone oxidase [Pseudonocardia sp. TRM90224]